jgi:hypothetical protein
MGSGGWLLERQSAAIAAGALRCFRTEEPRHFHVAHAKNVAHRLGRGRILFNLDADNFIGEETIESLQRIFDSRPRSVVTAEMKPDIGGRTALRREDFGALNGYDERFIGWGAEDWDLISRAVDYGLRQEIISGGRALPHDDTLRKANMVVPDVDLSPSGLSNLPKGARRFVAMLIRRYPELARTWVYNRRQILARAPSVTQVNPDTWGRARLVDVDGREVRLCPGGKPNMAVETRNMPTDDT